MADSSSSHRRTRSAMVNLLGGGGSSGSGSGTPIPPPSPRHSVHGSVLSSTQGNSQFLAPATDNTKKPRVSTGSRSVASDMKSDSNGSSTSLPASGQGLGSSVQSLPKSEGRSVEETVKVFRLYEALRSGDTAFISKTLRGSPEKGSAEVSTTARNQILHLAIQCAELPVIEYILLHTTPTPPSSAAQSALPYLDINTRDPTTGNTPLHVATQLARQDVLGVLLSQPTINDSVPNFQGKTPLDLARSPAVFEKLELAKSVFVENATKRLLDLIARRDYPEIEKLLDGERVKGWLDVNTIDVSPEFNLSDRPQSGSGKDINRRLSKITSKEGQSSAPDIVGGSTLLHEAARNKDTQLIQILLLHGADPFKRDKKGKLPQDITKDDKIKAVLKKSPAAAHAQRGIEERAILGGAQGAVGVEAIGEQGREMKGYLKKWTNYTGGWKLRWFVLEDGVLSYYKHQDDIGSACRGAINMRIASLHMDPQDKQRFEILGKNSVKYHLKANHVVEAKRWYWTLNNAIQWAKDEAREAEKRKDAEAERMGRLKELTIQQQHQQLQNQRNASNAELAGPTVGESTRSSSIVDLGATASELQYQGTRQPDQEVTKIIREEDSDSDDDDNDDESETNSRKEPPTSDALSLAANSARLQLDLLAQVCLALQFQRQEDPNTTLGDATVSAALEGYDTAVKSLKKLVGDVLKMTKERERYWKYRIGKEQDLRRLWEENMQRLVEEHEVLQGEVGMERGRRKKTKRALKEVLRREQIQGSAPASAIEPEYDEEAEIFETSAEMPERVSQALSSIELDSSGVAKDKRRSLQSLKPKSVALDLDSSSDDDDDEEFFDAVDAGEVEVQMQMPKSPPPEPVQEFDLDIREHKKQMIESSMIGYEKPPRTRLAMDSDDRPKISLWGILKSMIGKDMTRMTLPVSFNECTSLLQRVAEDMEYADLLDTAADRQDSTERMVYVAAFAASEYSSTTNRIAKPFNPLLGETYEYCRPDKGYRFLVEQVSHHPPIGAAWAEAPKWDYWGESEVESKFYGKSFDINPLGTWFLKLRSAGKEELYTWKKVTTSVVGIITGSPTVDNYGLMEITNHTTGDKCLLDFKQRGWTASTAYQVKGKILDAQGQHIWSIGGRWNDKIYARKSTGSNDTGEIAAPGTSAFKNQSTFLIWESNPRPNMPFNLTQFAVTLNELPENLKPVLCPTDTRLRPDQRAMEDGKYDFAANEKRRLEEKQRAKRREREASGEEYEPRWFKKSRCEVSGEKYWEFTNEYWEMRRQVTNGGEWKRVEDIF